MLLSPIAKTAREFSAGGVVIRHQDGQWWLAAIEPAGRSAPAKNSSASASKRVLTLPKGLIDPGERAPQTALREVREETGLEAEIIAKLGDVKYVYVRSWGDRARVFKVVTFYLLRYRSGRLGNIPRKMRHEVAHAHWLPLAEAVRMLTYPTDRKMVESAIAYLAAHPQKGGIGLF